MLLSEVIICPVLTEKASAYGTDSVYAFKVHKEANKIRIQEAVEAFYGVKVLRVCTLVVPAKSKSRFTRKGVLRGRRPSYKKAIVYLKSGDTIDFYSESV